MLVLYTDVSVLDEAGRLSVTVNGSGDGLFFCGGKAVEIQWSKEAGGQFYYSLEDGTPLTLERGRSYVCIISKGNQVTIPELYRKRNQRAGKNGTLVFVFFFRKGGISFSFFSPPGHPS